MKKLILASFVLILVAACSEKESNFSLTGNVDGLKKGTLYLQKMEDTLVANIDSVKINGDAHFRMEAYLKEPEILFLYLDKSKGDKHDDIVEFFAEKGEMTLNTTLKSFAHDAVITGSKNQEKLNAYQEIMRKFNDQHLDLIKENFDAQKANDDEKVMETDKKYQNWLRRKYLYTVNYAVNNKNLEVSPYLALSEVFDANITYLDTIYKSLDKNIQKSKYGKQLKKYIKDREKLKKLDEKIKKE